MTGGFGSSPFGGSQQQQPQSGGVFGQQPQQPASGGGFSFGQQPQQQQASTGFGAKPAGSTFGGFGATNTNQTGSTGFSFGGANNQQQPQQQQQSNPFGGASNAFGARPAATGGLFGSQPQQPATGGGLFGQPQPQQTGGLFGNAGASAAPAAVTQGSSNPPYQVTVIQEKDANNNQAPFAYQSISAMPQYKNMSFEELRVQDYEQGRKSGNASASTSSSFGFGQQQQPSTNAFGGAQTGGAFGQSQPQQQSGGLFGSQTGQTGGGLFGGQQQQQQQPATGGGLFGQQSNQPSTSGGLFGNTQQQQPSTGGFSFGGGNNNQQQQQQQQQQPASTGFSFGGANNNAAKPGGLFGGFGSTPQQNNTSSAGGFSFGQTNNQQQQGQQAGQTNTGFGGTSGGFSFGGANNAPKPGGLFGSSQPAAPTSQPGSFGGFGAASSATNNAPKPAFSFGGTSSSGGAFGSTPAPSTGGLFGGAQTSQPTTTSQPAPSGGLFGGFGTQNNQQQQQGQQPGAGGSTFGGFGSSSTAGGGGTGLFGSSTANKPGGLFGSTTTSQPQGQSGFGSGGTGGGFSFGGASNQQQGGQQQPQQQQQQKPGGFSFGQPSTGTGGGLFGSSNAGGGSTGGGLFGSGNTGGNTGGGLFGSSTNNQSTAGGGGGLFGSSTLGGAGNTGSSLFGASTNQQQQQQPQQQQQSNLPPQGVGLTSDPYGTDALFKSMTGGAAANQPALPFNVSAGPGAGNNSNSLLSASTRSKPLPAPMMSPFRPNPKNSSRIIKLRGGTPSGRESSPSAGANGAFGRSSSPAMNGAAGLFHGLSDEIGSPAGESSGLSTQAFASRPSVKRLILNDAGNNSGFGRSMRAGTEDVSGAGLKDSIFGNRGASVPPRSAQRGVAFSPALEMGLTRREQTAGAEDSFGDSSLNRSRNGLFADTPSKANLPQSKSRNLLASGEGQSAPVLEKEPSIQELPVGAYYMSPSLNALRRMSFQNLSRVDDFTVTRKGFGSVKFLRPVDLTGIHDLTNIAGGIVQLREKEIWVYPQAEDLEPDLDGMQAGYDEKTVPKAKQGQGLNVTAEVTLEKCWPLDRATRQPLKDGNHARVKQHIAKLQKKVETRFIEYEPVAGRWVFEVDHFSRYGLDDSDEDDAPASAKTQGAQAPRSASARGQKGSADRENVPPPRRRLTEGRHAREDAPPSLTSASSDEGEYADDDDELASNASTQLHDSELGIEDVKESTPRRPASKTTTARKSATPRGVTEGSRDGTPAFSQPWAAQLGLEPRRVQVMQASFFGSRAPGEKSDAATTQARTPGMVGNKGVGAEERVRNQRKTGQQSARNDFEGIKEEVEPLAPPRLIEVARDVKRLAHVDFNNSVVKGHEGNPMDPNLAFARSFRVGWGPGGLLAYGGRLEGVKISGDASKSKFSGEEPSFSQLKLSKVRVFDSSHDAEEADKAKQLLELQLAHSEIVSAYEGGREASEHETECPSTFPNADLRFGHFAAKFDHGDRSHEALVWRLGKALFDEIELRLPPQASPQTVLAITTLRRKAALSNWLSHAIAVTVESECRGHVAAGRKAALIFAHLTGNQIERACTAALDSGDVRLASLLAQIGGGDDVTRADVADQLAIWRDQGADVLISKDHRKVYEMLSGNVTLARGNSSRSVRDPMDRVEDLHIAAGLDWKRAFGLHLWYGTAHDAPLATALERYEDATHSDVSSDTAPPLPPYREKAGLGSLRLRELVKSGKYERDALFMLIKLHCDPLLDLESALSTFGFGPLVSDYRMLWHLYMLLSRVLRLRDFSDRRDLGVEMQDAAQQEGVSLEGNSARADGLTSDYASQLEVQGQWTWAAFVLLHLELPSSRTTAIKALLARNVAKFDQDSETFLTARLKIPRTWLYEAQAIAARYRDERFFEYELLLKACLYTQAHSIAVRHLAPEAIIRGDTEMILSLFTPFSEAFPQGRLDEVGGWTTGGELYVDYVACVQHLPYLIGAAETSPGGLEGMDRFDRERLSRLATRVMELLDLAPVHLFPDAETSLTQVVARSDMVAGLNNLARVLSLRNLLFSADDGQGTGAATATTAPAWAENKDVPPEIEHVQNAANDYMALLLQA